MKNNAKQEKKDLIVEVDLTIKAVCKKLQKEDVCPGEYADVVKALAGLVVARALVD